MKLKIIEQDGKTFAEVQDGKPVYIDGDKEIAFDAVGTRDTITRLNSEARGHREAKEAAEKALKSFEGISDPAAALKAMETIQSLDQKKLIDAGEVEKVKSEISKAYDEKLEAERARADQAASALNKEIIGGSFARSKYISDNVAIPADLIQAQFGNLFSLNEEGKLVAKYADGNQVFSKANPGNPAPFDEALEMIIDQYPHKDHILKGTGNSGGGSKGSDGGGSSKTMRTSDFNALSAKDKAAKMAESGFTLIE